MLRVNQRGYVQRAEALIQEVSECVLNHHCMALHRLHAATHSTDAKATATGGGPTSCYRVSRSKLQTVWPGHPIMPCRHLRTNARHGHPRAT